ncbi:MAG: CAP domain-containing protein [Bacteroidota bacterium]|nr:CAP domain-containing protein [Bacteroidota bacterium]
MFLLAIFISWLTFLTAVQLDSGVPAYYSITWQEFEKLTAARKTIPLKKPDYELLDAAIFQVTNKVREKEGVPVLQYLPALHRSATFHAQTMIDLDFYDHYNFKQLSYLTPDKRITAFGGFFHYSAENIAQYDIIDTEPEYCPIQEGKGYYNYLNCDTRKPFKPYTYLGYAETLVDGWLHSPPHRKSLLSINFQYMGCAARISKNPYQQRHVPFARVAQNFGGYGPPNSKSAPTN